MNKLDTEKLKQELDALCKKYPGTNSDTLRKYEEKHEYINTHGPLTYGRFKDQSRAWFDLANHIIIGLNYIEKKSWSTHRSLQYLFVTHNVRIIYSATDRLLKSHWEDSLILCRVALEALVRIIWISCHPERSNAGVHKTNEGKQFNFTSFVRDELKIDWNDYKLLSMFSHSNQADVIKDWVAMHNKTKQYPITLERTFDKKEFEMCVNYIEFLEIAYLLFLTEILATETSKKHLPIEIIHDSRKLVRIKQKFMESHAHDYWPQVMNDMNDLIELIKQCDKGNPDYKKYWSKIRK